MQVAFTFFSIFFLNYKGISKCLDNYVSSSIIPSVKSSALLSPTAHRAPFTFFHFLPASKKYNIKSKACECLSRYGQYLSDTRRTQSLELVALCIIDIVP